MKKSDHIKKGSMLIIYISIYLYTMVCGQLWNLSCISEIEDFHGVQKKFHSPNIKIRMQ